MKKHVFIWILLLAALGLAGCQEGSSDHFYSRAMEEFFSDRVLPDTSLAGMSQGVCLLPEENDSDGTLFEAEGAGLFNETTKEVLYVKNPVEKIYPASLTKLMTALVTVNACSDLDTLVTVPEEAISILPEGASLAGLEVGCSYTVRDLLYALLVPSGNDAANTLAIYVGGSMEGFVDMMNQEAAELGMVDSHFENPNGLHDANHYTTVYDLYLLTRACLSKVQIVSIGGSRDASITAHRADGRTYVKSFNSSNSYMLGYTTPPDGLTIRFGKTGFTNSAGRCLIMVMKNSQGENLIGIIVKADTYDHLYQEMNGLLSLAADGQ